MTWRHRQVEHIKMMETRMYNKMNLIDLLLHVHKRTTTPTAMKKEKEMKNKTMKRMFHHNPSKISHELEKESKETIPSNKSLMTFKPGELVGLKLVWLIFVSITHHF